MAIGRKPNVQGLCGPDVSLEMKNGKIAVSPGFETSEPGVYAIGDVCADIQLAHVAAAQGTYVVEKIAGRPHTIRLQSVPSGMYVSLPIVPNCIYTDPEIIKQGGKFHSDHSASHDGQPIEIPAFSRQKPVAVPHSRKICSRNLIHHRNRSRCQDHRLTLKKCSLTKRRQWTGTEEV